MLSVSDGQTQLIIEAASLFKRNNEIDNKKIVSKAEGDELDFDCSWSDSECLEPEVMLAFLLDSIRDALAPRNETWPCDLNNIY